MHKDKCQFTMWLWKLMGIQLCYTLLSITPKSTLVALISQFSMFCFCNFQAFQPVFLVQSLPHDNCIYFSSNVGQHFKQDK